jgi:transposase
MNLLEEQNSILNYNDRLVIIKQGELTQLKRNAAYYKSQFEIKKRKTLRLLDFCRELKGEKKKFWYLLFGKKSETSKKGDSPSNPDKKKRGKRKGSQGYGRNNENQLPTTVEILDLPENERKCTCCGLEFEDLNCTSDSEVIEVEVKAHRRIIKRKTYKKTCKCKKTPTLIRAPSAPKLIPKGKFGVSFWVYVLLQKYCYHLPVNRILNQLSNQGLSVSGGTIVGGLEYIKKLLLPIYEAIELRNQSENHWHADETRWMVFASFKDKKGHRWYVWIFQSETTVYYKIAPTRGAQVVKDHFKNSFGIISADRYAAYKTLIETGLFLIAFCWAHVRNCQKITWTSLI